MSCVDLITTCIMATDIEGEIENYFFYFSAKTNAVRTQRTVSIWAPKTYDTRGVQYVMKTAQYIPKFYIYTLHNYFH